MLIHLSDISSSQGKTIEVEAPFELKELEFHPGRFPVTGADSIHLTITNTGDKKLKLQGRTVIRSEAPCDRCLENVPFEVPVQFEHKLDMAQLTDESHEETGDEVYLSGMDLDLDQLIRLETLMAWPAKILCRDDCRGICFQCGKNLNHGPCDCQDVPKDMRMAAISDIFSKFKEV